MTRAGGARKVSSGHGGRRLGEGFGVCAKPELRNRRFEPEHIRKMRGAESPTRTKLEKLKKTLPEILNGKKYSV